MKILATLIALASLCLLGLVSSPADAQTRIRDVVDVEGVRQNERYRAIPILVLTTESDAEKKNRAREAGATGWIVKPFDPSKLIAAIERVTA